jgi:putative DNA primase/helicase
VWFITGNNIAMAQDMTTRFLSCALQPSAARPDQRTFRRDLALWVAQNRARVVAAGLTILRAYRVAGAPPVGGKPSRFRTWDINVRHALVHAGGLDVGAKFDEADLADSGLGALRRLLRLWPAVMGAHGVRAKEIEMKCAYPSGETETEFAEALRDLMIETKGKAVTTAHAIGACLTVWKDRVVGGYRLARLIDRHDEVTTWRAVPVGAGD